MDVKFEWDSGTPAEWMQWGSSPATDSEWCAFLKYERDGWYSDHCDFGGVEVVCESGDPCLGGMTYCTPYVNYFNSTCAHKVPNFISICATKVIRICYTSMSLKFL